MLETEQLLILKTIQYSDDDLVVHALSLLGQKRVLFARAARKSKKRFAGGVLEPTHYIRAIFRKTSEESMATLQEASLVYAFPELRKSYERLETALYFLELVDKVSLEESMDSSSLFDLLGNALKTLETLDNPESLKFHFEVRFLALQGVLPQDAEFEPYMLHSVKETGKVASLVISKDARYIVKGALESYLG